MATNPPINITAFQADWNNDGTIDDDLRDDLLGGPNGGFSFSYGNDVQQVLFPPRSGNLRFGLLNTTNKYFPQGGGSPGSNVKPGRTVRVRMRRHVSGDNTYVFRGRIAGIDPLMDRNQVKAVHFSARDFLGELVGKRVTIPVHEWRDTGYLIGEILDAVGWSASDRTIDTGMTRVPLFWANNIDAFALCASLVAAEGPSSSLYYSPSLGHIVFRNRHHRLLNEATSVLTFKESGASGTTEADYTQIKYDIGWSRIVNDVALQAVEYTRAPLGVVGVGPNRIYKVDSTATSHPTAVTISIVLDEPADSIVTPVADRDYTVISGNPVTPSVNQTSALTVDVTFTATLGVSIITGQLTPNDVGEIVTPDQVDKLDTVQLVPGKGVINPTGANILKGKSYRGINVRGRSIQAVSTQQITNTASASVNQYGKRSLPVEVPWLSQRQAEDYAVGVVQRYQDPTEVYGLQFRHGSDSAAVAAVVGQAPDTRVTVQSTEAGLNQPAHIEALSASVTEAGRVLDTTIWVSATSSTGTGSYLVLNSTADGILGTNTLAF